MDTRKRFRLNVAGPFYVEDGSCITCGAPEVEAPTLIASVDAPENHCYFKKQPETPEELDQAITAVHVSCCEGVRYGGDDPAILARIERLRDRRVVAPQRGTAGRRITLALLGLVLLGILLWIAAMQAHRFGLASIVLLAVTGAGQWLWRRLPRR